MPDALVHHPREGYVGHITWYVVTISSSDVRVHAGEPALSEVRQTALVFVARRDVPQVWREGTTTLV